MTYPAIADQERRDRIARTIHRWRIEAAQHSRTSKRTGRNQIDALADMNRQWIYGMRRALQIIGED